MSGENTANKTGWLSRLRVGLKRSSSKLSEGITGIFTQRKLDSDALNELEELLITADLGPVSAARLVSEFGKGRFGKEITDHDVRLALANSISDILAPCARPLVIDRKHKPFVVLVVGVNGTGKTTTIGKLSRYYRSEGLNVMMAAGDTFRAAAISQLQIWGERTGSKVISGAEGGESAALAYQALQQAKTEGTDILFIDTAGRLHNKKDLMQELAKTVRVLKKIDETAPHATLLVLDSTTGQNAHSQVEVFSELASITGLIVTKLDGSAKGGVLVGLADRFKLPIHAIGVGEQADDLRPFKAEDFARSLVGLE
ncbi:MAG: signal recognition particle-docking protein FtsY [Alphaproteobacteria bacterium]|nr:signal recognition particle-docking protein FtsY [Alphaproteobacteria bacterium]